MAKSKKTNNTKELKKMLDIGKHSIHHRGKVFLFSIIFLVLLVAGSFYFGSEYMDQEHDKRYPVAILVGNKNNEHIVTPFFCSADGQSMDYLKNLNSPFPLEVVNLHWIDGYQNRSFLFDCILSQKDFKYSDKIYAIYGTAVVSGKISKSMLLSKSLEILDPEIFGKDVVVKNSTIAGRIFPYPNDEVLLNPFDNEIMMKKILHEGL